MLDDFIMNDSYDAWSEDYDEQMELWEEFVRETESDLKN